MTPDEIRAARREAEAREDALRTAMLEFASQRYRLTLELEEAEGRPQSREARFARAWLAGDWREASRINDEPAIVADYAAGGAEEAFPF